MRNRVTATAAISRTGTQLVQRGHGLQVVALDEHVVSPIALVAGTVGLEVASDARPDSAAEAVGVALARETDPDTVFLMRLDERDQFLAGEVVQRHVLAASYVLTR
jgi:hypothetical protein